MRILIFLGITLFLMAAQYKQRENVIEAIQWICSNISAVKTFIAPADLTKINPARPNAADLIGVPTVAGIIAADCKGAPGTNGDWIVKKAGLLTVEANAEFILTREPIP